ncbi:hypothetical protein [Rhodoferax sp. OV413]|nr:hypothetical protein [Rhodoferax sp. OV413]
MHTRTLQPTNCPLVEYALAMVGAEISPRSPATAAPRKRKEKSV